jgi:GTP-binding protein
VRLVDTAGLRKRAKIEDKLEKLSRGRYPSRHRLCRSRRRCCSTPTRGLEAQDLRSRAGRSRKAAALLIALNKWDVAENALLMFNGVKAALDEGLSQLRDVPCSLSRPRPARAIDTILKVAFELRESWSRRMPTGELNRWFEAAIDANPPPAPKGPADQAPLHHPGQHAPADLRGLRPIAPTSFRKATVAIWSTHCAATSSLAPCRSVFDFRGRSNPFDRDRR